MSDVKRRIIVEDGRWRCEEGRIVAEGNADDIMPAIQKRMTIQPLFLPHRDGGCAAFAQNESRKIFVMYLEPKNRLIRFYNEATRQRLVFSVVTPHIYIAVFFRNRAVESGYAMIAKEKVKDGMSPVGVMPLPNISPPYGLICEGARGMWTTDQSQQDVCLSYIDYFFESDFTAHINEHGGIVPPELQPGGNLREDVYGWNESFLDKWQDFCKEKSVDDILKIGWFTNISINDLIQKVWNQEV